MTQNARGSLCEHIGNANSKPCAEGQDWKERRKTKVHCAYEVLDLKSKGSECFQASGWSGQEAGSLTSHWLIRTICLTPGHSSFLSQSGTTQWSLGTGDRRNESMPGLSHRTASKLVTWNRRAKLSSSEFNAWMLL